MMITNTQSIQQRIQASQDMAKRVRLDPVGDDLYKGVVETRKGQEHSIYGPFGGPHLSYYLADRAAQALGVKVVVTH